jgi:siroheme synthase
MRIVAKRLTRKQIKPDRIKKVVIEKARNNNKVEDIFVYEMDWDYSRVPLEV